MIRRIRIAFIIILLSVGMFGSTNVMAKGHVTKAYNIEQIQSSSPNIKVYVNGRKIDGNNEFSAKVSGSDITEDMQFVCQDISQFAVSGEGIHYIILLDNSYSVENRQFNQTKKELIKLRKRMKKNEKMTLYTVGSNHSKGNKKCIVNANGKNNLQKDIAAINNVKRKMGKTVLYRSLTQILETADNSNERVVVLLLTDGEDDSQGKNNKTYQVNPAVKNTKIPVYGILLKNIGKHTNKEKIRNTKKNILEEKISRGYYKECENVQDVKKGFENIREILYDETYIVTLSEKNNSNKITTDAKLSMLCDSYEIKWNEKIFSYNQIGEEDTTAPVLRNIQKTGDNSISFMIEDDKTKNILGGSQPENYTIKDADGNDWTIDKVNVDSAKNTYELIFKEKLYSGDYTIHCNGITDDSQEKNKIVKVTNFTFEGLNKKTESLKKGIKSYWWIGLFIVILLIGAAIIVLLKKHSGKNTEVDASTLLESDTRLIAVTITDSEGVVRDVAWNVEGSIFVGRSKICDIYFENDENLSKQHFVIEITKAACYIEDLETTNGTMVNGVKISSRRMLSDGDVITAGKEKIVYHATNQ